MTTPPPNPNAALIKAAEDFAAKVKTFDGSDPIAHSALLKEADNLRFLLESPFDRMMKQWEHVSSVPLFLKMKMKMRMCDRNVETNVLC